MNRTKLAPSALRGTVIGSCGGRCVVHTPDGPERTYGCVIAGKLRQSDNGELVVGDEVEFTLHGPDGLIHQRLPRRTVLRRQSAGRSPAPQVLAANVDLLLITIPADMPVRTGLIDRYLVLAADGGLEAAVVVTKSDLAPEDPLLRTYASLGYPVVVCSAVSGAGLEDVHRLIAGRTVVLAGHSGTGKTALLNALAPDQSGRTGVTNRHTGKGRHTTSASQMVFLPGGGRIIDTPGVRELGLGQLTPAQVQAGFREIATISGQCRFGSSCTHRQEPDCAVRAAAADGRVHPGRYTSYLKLIGAEVERDDDKEQVQRDHGGFVCVRCGRPIPADAPGTDHRNHCPHCLWSVHLDRIPGDRAAGCGAAMEPIAVWVRTRGEWTILHRCTACNAIRPNRIAGDDSDVVLMSMAVKPLANPPFPLDRLGGVAVTVGAAGGS